MRQPRGFVLLVVLWSMALLALIGARLTGNGRGEAQIARNLLSAAIAETAADGAVREAVFRVLAPGEGHWPADGLARVLRIGAATVETRVISESGKINPNRAPAALIAALLRRLGTEPAMAERVAVAMFDWRTPGRLSLAGGDKFAPYRAAGRNDGPSGQPFESLDEIGLVRGVTPELLAALRPYLSVYNESGIDARFAAPAVRAALADLAIGFDAPDDGKMAVTISALAVLADGTRVARGAVIRLHGLGAPRPWQVLTWGTA